MPHALLVHGPQGLGKLQLAERLAQRVLCESAAEGEPCGKCPGCRWFEAGSHPDFRRVEPEALARPPAEDAEAPATSRAAKPSQEIKVDQIRALDDFLNLQSHRGGPRVALIHPAEAMNPNAANALLKGLEEPPGRAQFILVSHLPARLLATLRSRCVALPVAIPSREAALAWLERQGLDDAASWLAFASGSPLRALQHAQAGTTLAKRREALKAGDRDALGLAGDREQLEELAEVLQKHALDQAFAAYCGRTKYGAAAAGSASGAAWLRFARLMGRNRALARHPLNPRLFAYEMLSAMPRK